MATTTGNVEHYSTDAYEYDYLPKLDTELGQSELRRAQLLARLAERIESPFGLIAGSQGRFADLGMGGGQLMQLLSEKGYAVAGFDIALRNCARVRSERFSGTAAHVPAIAAADIYTLPLASESLNGVFISEVLEHLEDPAAALREAFRVLIPGGFAVISCPWRERLIFHLCLHCNKPTPANGHLHSVSEEKMDDWLQDAGLVPGAYTRFNFRAGQALGLSRRTASMPYGLWRIADRCTGWPFYRPLHFATVARRPR